MNIIQFLRIFWARRAIVAISLAASLLGAYIVVLIVQPRYEATARVLLNIIRPDTVTGEIMGAKSSVAYFDSQIEFIKDYRVTGRVVDEFGWLSDPGRIGAYSNRSASDTREFRPWLAQSVVDSFKPKIGGIVLEITYKAPTPAIAQFGAETLRRVYLEESLALRRREATANAEWHTKQAESAREFAEVAEMKKAAFEKESGIIMQGRDSDLDSDRLTALAGQAAVGPMVSMAAQGASQSTLQLAWIDSQLADAAQRLGPNHPEMMALRTRRNLVAQVVAQEQAVSNAATSGATGAAVIARALQEQKSLVLGQRDKVERLRQLQSEVDLRRDQYRNAASRAAQYLLESAVVDVGLTPLGVVVAPQNPAFPNKALILGGAGAMGLGLGLALALLLELLGRRVRGVEDLDLSSEIHCLGVIEQPRETTRGNIIGRLFGLVGRQLPKRAAA